MKIKSITFCAALLCLISGINAQGYNPQLDSIKARYQFLDSNYTTTGILYDRFPISSLGDSIYHAHPKNYQGLPATDSLSSFSIGKNLLRNLFIASYHPKFIPNGSIINQEMRQIESNGNIPLAVTRT